jgi:chemotaxis protein CheY-P-specific phosphatase CheC
MENLDTNELSFAKTMVRKGLLKAAESLSFFMKEDLGIKEFNFQINDAIECPNKSGENIHLLTTEVMGDLPGICYLVFSEEEANKLREIALSVEIRSNPEFMAEMKDAIMLEVDNIISASVITEFSNILNHKIYGNVPSLRLVDENELKQLVTGNLKKDLFIINFKTQFMSSNVNFCPEFVWLFDRKFVNSIKLLANEQNNRHCLN